MTSDTALLVTCSYDVAADYVERELQGRDAAYFRLDTDTIADAAITFDPAAGFVIRRSGRTVSSNQISSVWYRRHVPADLPDHLTPGVIDFCQREYRALVNGTIRSLSPTRWISHPGSIAQAEAKPYQLAIASQLGFYLPKTLVTNDPEHAHRFASAGPTVAKAVSTGYIREGSDVSGIFTNRIRDVDLNDMSGLPLAPVIFQEHVEKRSDIRVTVVGHSVFAAEILSQDHPSSSVDWRATADGDLRHKPHKLPPSLAGLCQRLLVALGLSFGALDFALTNEGKYVFLEVNPSGEWVWIEDLLGYPIAAEIAKLLDTNRN